MASTIFALHQDRGYIKADVIMGTRQFWKYKQTPHSSSPGSVLWQKYIIHSSTRHKCKTYTCTYNPVELPNPHILLLDVHVPPNVLHLKNLSHISLIKKSSNEHTQLIDIVIAICPVDRNYTHRIIIIIIVVVIIIIIASCKRTTTYHVCNNDCKDHIGELGLDRKVFLSFLPSVASVSFACNC